MDIEIAKAQQNDLDSVESLYNDICDYLADKEYNPGWHKGYFPTRADALQYLNNDTLYVAKNNGKVVGSMAFDNSNCPDILFLHIVVVHPDYLRHHISTKMLSFAQSIAMHKGIRSLRLYVWEQNSVAIKAYEQNGYQRIAREDIGLGEYGLKWFYLYEKSLSQNNVAAIPADCHLHSSYSGDSNTPMEEMILAGIARGLQTMCFTEHNDFNFPDSPDGPGDLFLLNVDAYLYDLIKYKEKYADKIRILFGVELGLQPEVVRQNAVFAKSHDFDFIIGSTHICHDKDPYYPSFYEGRSDVEAYREYFESIYENIKKFSNFDVCGHLDYAVRYGANRDRDYSYEKYQDIFDKILTLLIDKGIGLEVNTAGLNKGMREQHPCTGVLKRYREMGGEIITIGSDAHDSAHISSSFDKIGSLLTECGFRYYTVFEKRMPEFIRLP